MWARMDNRHLNIVFFEILLILLEVHVGQFGINFDKHAEIHLYHRK
jgi:hypothetical protein